MDKPGIGAFIELGKIANDSTAALADVTEAMSEATETFSKLVGETSVNIDKGLDNLEREKQRFKTLSNNLTNMSNSVNNVSNKFKNVSDVANNSINNSINKVTPNIRPNIRPTTIQTGGFKKMSQIKQQIGGRINDSLAEFSDPISYQTGILKGGHNKTKKAMVNGNDRKSRRVRFSM